MRFTSVIIDALAGRLPPDVVSSDEIEARLAPVYERIGLNKGRLELMTGIRERRYWPSTMLPSEASAEVGRSLFERVSWAAHTIDLLIHCAVCRDRLEPATAAYVHKRLGLAPHAQVFDLSNACLGFVNGLLMAAGMVESGQIRRALLTSGENGRPLLEKTIDALLKGSFDRRTIKPLFANLTIGAAAVAFSVTSLAEAPAQPYFRLKAATVETESAASELCEGGFSADGALEMTTHAEELLEAGLGVAERNWARFLAETGWKPDSIDRVICHQVGRAHQRQMLERLGIPEEKDFPTYSYLGNTGSAALPITLERALEAGAIKPGDNVALLGIGSGLSSVMVGVTLEEGSPKGRAS